MKLLYRGAFDLEIHRVRFIPLVKHLGYLVHFFVDYQFVRTLVSLVTDRR